jgi:hypothetical protein
MLLGQNIFVDISICLELLYTVVFVYFSLKVHYFTKELYCTLLALVQRRVPRDGRESNQDPYLAVDTRAK